MTNDDQEPLIRISRAGASIISDRIADKMANKKMSPSMVTGLEGCATKWLGEQVIREFVEPEIDNAANRGTLFHAVMENFFKLPADERTKDNMKIVARETMQEDKHQLLAQVPEARAWLWDAIRGYYSMRPRPDLVEVAEIALEGRQQQGLEVFVQGKIGKSTRNILGFVDMVTVDTTDDNGGLVVSDWKSGAVKKWVPGLKNKYGKEEGFEEFRQQMIYTMLLEDAGYTVSSARLLFPVFGEVANVDINNEELRERTIATVEEGNEAFDHMLEDNLFEPTPTVLCHWCPMARICPAANIFRNPTGKLKAAYDAQPSIGQLSQGIEQI